jgi:hypothetical protein
MVIKACTAIPMGIAKPIAPTQVKKVVSPAKVAVAVVVAVAVAVVVVVAVVVTAEGIIRATNARNRGPRNMPILSHAALLGPKARVRLDVADSTVLPVCSRKALGAKFTLALKKQKSESKLPCSVSHSLNVKLALKFLN